MSIKYSYSRLNTYVNCPWRYKLQYMDHHYIFDDTLATELGTLIHHEEEIMGKSIIAGEPIDYGKLTKDFYEINVPKKSPQDTEGGIYGINILSKKYPEDFYNFDDKGQSYFTKCQDYTKTGIHRLEQFLAENPDLELVAVEKYFDVTFEGYEMMGFIDRVFRRKSTGEYIISDIKTKDHPFKDTELTTPLQFVVYSIALKSIYGLEDYPSECFYELPIAGIQQKAGTKGFIKRGLKKIRSIFDGISNEVWAPKPSALCHWCPFCYTNPKQKEEGKKLCCYYSLWTPGGKYKSYDVMNKWEGIERNDIVMARFLNEQQEPGKNSFDFDFTF